MARRARTLNFSGLLTLQDVGGWIAVGASRSQLPRFLATLDLPDTPELARVEIDITSVATGFASGNLFVSVTGVLKAKVLWGPLVTVPVSWNASAPLPGPADGLRDLSGSWSISIPVEELEVVSLLPAALLDSDNFPNYGGPPQKDGMVGRQVYWVERTVVGGTATATISCGSFTATATAVISSAIDANYLLYTDVRAEVYTQGSGVGDLTVVSTRQFGGVDMPVSVPYDYSQGTHRFRFETGLISVRSQGSSSGGSRLSYGSGWAEPAREFRLSGRARRFDAPLDSALALTIRNGLAGDVDVPASSGVWGHDFAQFNERAQAVLDGHTKPLHHLYTVGPVFTFVKRASLALMGEDVRDWRSLIHGSTWNTCLLSHAGTLVVEDGASASDWTPGANTTVSASGGAIRLVVAGGTGLATWSGSQNAEGYRFLRVRIRSTVGSSRAFRVSLGSKAWEGVTGAAGSWVDFDMDLCNPGNRTLDVDGKSSRYPLTGFGGAPVDSQMWGVSVISSLVFGNLADGETYEVDAISLRRASWAKASWLPAFTPWTLAWVSPSDEVFHKSGWWSDVDGRVTDACPTFKVVPNAGATYYRPYTILEMIAGMNATGGYTCTALAMTDSYYNGSRDGFLLGGAGATVNTETGTWTEWLDRDASGTLTVPAQALWDCIAAVPPLWGRSGWQGGSFPGAGASYADRAVPVCVQKVLRAHAWGLVLEDAVPRPGEPVSFRRDSDGDLRGSDSSDAIGHYRTELPYAQAPLAHSVSASGLSHGVMSSNRMRHRAVLAPVEEDGEMHPFILTRFPAFHYVASIREGRVFVRMAGDGVPSTWQSEVFADAAEGARDGCAWPFLAASPSTGRLTLLYERAGAVEWRWSDSDGRAWSPYEALGSGFSPMVVFDAEGLEVRMWFVYDSGSSGPGTLAGKLRAPGDNSFTTFTAKDLSGANLAIADGGFRNLTVAQDGGQGRLIMAIVVDGESEPSVWFSHDQGRRWKRSLA